MQEEDQDFSIGISKNLVSCLLLCLLNFGIMCTFALPYFSLWTKLLLWALFVFIGVLMPYCIGLAQYDKLEKLVGLLSPIMVILNYTVTFVGTLPVV
ncbi:MAG: hypothetical protein RR253_01245, partial [Oscillospiraceae bacterium]